MFKTLKWVYGLGVTQERQRIAAHLERAGYGARTEAGHISDMLNSNQDIKAFKTERLRKMEFNQAINERIGVIIDGIFRSEGQWVGGKSILYPEEKK